MQLSDQQLDRLDEDGYLVLPGLFSKREVEVVQGRLPGLMAEPHPGNIIEKSSGLVRTSMGLHARDAVLNVFVRHPRLIDPATQILGEPFYIQQVKINIKGAFSGEPWQWHYDFATHHREDGVEKPLALNLHVFLNEVTEFNGPLYFIPGSHKTGLAGVRLDTESTSYPLWVVEHERVSALANERGLFSATGRPGTALIFHDTLLHASGSNISPWERSIFSLIVNPVSNAGRNLTRPDFKHHRDFTAVEAVEDDCLDRWIQR